MTVDPTLAAKAGTMTPINQDSAVRTIGRGLQTAPILRQGLGLTWLLAAIGAAGRVVVPLLIQQAIDDGLAEGEVQIDVIVRMSAIAAWRWSSRASPCVRRRSGWVCAANGRSTISASG